MDANPRYAYWATIELYRTFLFEDGPFLETIADAGGALDGPTLARIAHSYSVARTIPKAPGDDPAYNVDIFARSIIKLAQDWPSDTFERAQACRRVASDLRSDFKYKEKEPGDGGSSTKPRQTRAPHSAVTKLIWFLKPKGWTVFDRYAADAVLIGGDANVGERQKRFYAAIAKPLAVYAEQLRKPLARLDSRLHAERLIDKYLVIKGLSEDGYCSACIRNQYFLRLLPKDLASVIDMVAEDMPKILPDSAFTRQKRI